ncbi:glycosyltransferase family 4 protein [Sediminicola sp. 1XM1-17]|uniref:glycosyltransferase family 4 protein n=1 Tax=Sediminicola sp. 1XM1-17 TaxID=3127702 RepID=UPI003076EF98
MKLTIALCHFRVGETDGVSLEMDKWKLVLEKLGHNVIYVAGSKGTLKEVEIIEELHYNDATNNKVVENAYVKFQAYNSEEAFKQEIEKEAASIETKLLNIIKKKNIDLLMVNNMFSLGWNLSAGLGFFNAIKNSDVKCLCHHHDFHWEREKYSHPTCAFVKDYLKTIFPPSHPRIKHVVINTIAKNELYKRRQIESTVVPNVFDFDNDWKVDDFNADFRSTFGIKENDLIILQATRIVQRKGIELALDVVSELNTNKHKLAGKTMYNGQVFGADSNIVFLMVGLNEDPPYFDKIMRYAQQKKVDIRWVNDHIDHERSDDHGHKKYSLWDAYAHCDLVTYTSLLEGWGNQFIEALVAKKIIISYQYPVFVTDILPLNFHTVDLGDQHTLKEDGLASVKQTIIDRAAEKTIELLLDGVTYQRLTSENYTLGKKNLSMDALERLLKSIVQNEG